MSHFTIRCGKCGMDLKDTFCALCEHCRDVLPVSHYTEPFRIDNSTKDIWKFNWLPVHNPDFHQPGPLVYRSRGLSDHLGIDNLYIAFSGYWPEKGSMLKTCTFKELEAAVVLQNARENSMPGLTVASAGNTARAFCHLASSSGFPAIIVVPRMCLSEMWYLRGPVMVPTLVVGDGDYSDSIDVAKKVALLSGMPFEGGVQNIAKRDGLGIVMLEAVSTIGKLPDHYFQAVGSGAGAIGVWEMSERLLRDGRFGSRPPKLHLAQNLPFAPMVKAWRQRSRILSADDLRPELIGEITTRVLSSRYPAYGITGGIFDALTASCGETYGIENREVFEAQDIFEAVEGIDIAPAAGVAVAALTNALRARTIGENDTILLNITGGGEKRFLETHKRHEVQPVFVSKTISDKELDATLWTILKKSS